MAESQDSLEFYAKYKDWLILNKMPVTDQTKPIEIAEYLSSVRHSVDAKAFSVIGLDTATLDAYTKKITKGLKANPEDLVKAYTQLGSAEAKEAIEKATKNTEELKPFAQSYLLRSVLAGLDVDFRIDTNKQSLFGHGLSPEEREGARQRFTTGSTGKGKAESPAGPEGVFFLAKYKDWVCIKKMNIRDNTHPAEVAAHLATIRMAVDRKAAQVCGVDTMALDIYAEKATSGMRKSAKNLAKMFETLDSAEAKQEISKASGGDSKRAEVGRIYLLSKMAENVGFDFELNPLTVGKVYPALKIPKPKGRMPGQKGKKRNAE
jgi:hypothetical protein